MGKEVSSWEYDSFKKRKLGTLIGKSMEVVDIEIRRRINFMGLQETKWVGEKGKKLDSSRFKLWYRCKVRSINGVDITMDKE